MADINFYFSWLSMKKRLWLIFTTVLFANCSNGQLSASPINESKSSAENKADLVIIEKSKRLLSLYKSEKLLSSFHVSLGTNPVGAKEQIGDGKTPEGRYRLDNKKLDSNFYKAIHISYPNAKDLENAKNLGVSPGGDIMIHGQKNGYSWATLFTQRLDWTKGCIALSNSDMDLVWDAVDVGTAVDIRP
jgi:murein L,D-transpeptidase YafK